MPLLVIGAVGVVGGALLVRFALREARRINAELDELRRGRAPDQEARPTLRRDPVSDEYRVM